jgi:RND family efflux transporter MFP subunit
MRCAIATLRVITLVAFAALVLALASCTSQNTEAKFVPGSTVGRLVSVVRVTRTDLKQQLTISSELVPFQQIDVYAKESGFVRKLNVDYGTHVRSGDVMAVLEIPELQMRLEEDDAEVRYAAQQIDRARSELSRIQAQHDVVHLQYTRLNAVATSKPGMVTPQEVDDQHAKDLATEAQVEASESAVQSAESQLARTQAKRRHDQALFDYSRITAPFSGVVTKRYANLGTLMQSGITSSTQAIPLVQLSQDDLFRLVIPIPESYVSYIRIGDPVNVRVADLHQIFSGRVTRLSVDVQADTRTMHTEVDVPNPKRVLIPGVYAEATLTLSRKTRVLSVPLQAVVIEAEQRSVWVVGPSDRMEQRKVTLGLETTDRAEVVSGLKGGELVAVGDRSSLRAGETVQPKEVQLLRYKSEQ